MYKPYSLTFVIRCDGKFYLGDDNPQGWGLLEAACLYTEGRAAEKHRELSCTKRCEILCIVQDEKFNFYDGHKFVYALKDAKLYTPSQGQRVADELRDAS